MLRARMYLDSLREIGKFQEELLERESQGVSVPGPGESGVRSRTFSAPHRPSLIAMSLEA